jgi:hypothetical protein
MTAPLRPDLARILPKPWVQRLAPTAPPFRAAMSSPRPAAEDFLVDVRPPPATNEAEAPGFGLGQAAMVAARVQRWFRDDPARPSLHRPDAERSAGLLAHVDAKVPPTSLLAPAPAAPATSATPSPP